MRNLLILFTAVASLALAGCTSADDGSPAGDETTYRVPVEAAHAINGADQTVRIVVSQAGTELGSATYNSAGKTQDDFEQLFVVTAKAGALKIEVFNGNNPLNFKSIDPARCTDPDFQVHLVDGAAHLWSNCD